MVLSGYEDIHKVTGKLSREGFGTRLTPEKLEAWAAELERIAGTMRDDAKKLRPKPRRKK